MPARTCSFPDCPKTEELKKCSVCKIAAYCSKEHQTGDWGEHKVLCKQFKQRRQQQAVETLAGLLVHSDDVKAVDEYIRKKWDINAFDSDGWTPLMIAALFNRVKCMKALLEAKAGLEVKVSESGSTALNLAAVENNTECVKLLRKFNADCNAVGEYGRTPLFRAGGMTPLNMAAENGHTACLKLLLDAKANCDVTFDEGATPMHVAVVANQRVCLKMLIDAKADLEKRDLVHELTPLMVASMQGHIDCVSELVEAKAIIKAVSKNGNTALYYAQEGKHDDVVAVLTGQSAMVHIKKTKKKKKKKEPSS